MSNLNPAAYILNLQHTYMQALTRPKPVFKTMIPLYRQNYMIQMMNIELEYVAHYIFTEIKWHDLLLHASQKGINYVDIPIDRPYILNNYKTPSEWINIIDGQYTIGPSGPMPAPTTLVDYLQDFLKCRSFEGIVPTISRVYERISTQTSNEEKATRYIVRLSFHVPPITQTNQ